MSRPTKGPWMAWKERRGGWKVGVDPAPIICSVTAANGEADARLIAQSPSMYDLIARLATWECTCRDLPQDFTCEVCRSREIIEAIEGP